MAQKDSPNDELNRKISEVRQHFDQLCEPLRPALHRFCTRMIGGPCDGEDVLQEALMTAFYRMDELRTADAFRTWLFRIAHNKCIDVLRARQREPRFEHSAFPELADEAVVGDPTSDRERVAHVLANIMTILPAKERACVVLKDVLDCSLEETAEISASSVGSVKAALHRARTELARAAAAPYRQRRMHPDRRAAVDLYVEAFNRRDWDTVQAMLTDDAWLDVVHRGAGPFNDACYFVNHEKLGWQWRLELGLVDGEEHIVRYRQGDEGWTPQSIVELGIDSGRIAFVRDYIHVDYLLAHADVSASAGDDG